MGQGASGAGGEDGKKEDLLDTTLMWVKKGEEKKKGKEAKIKNDVDLLNQLVSQADKDTDREKFEKDRADEILLLTDKEQKAAFEQSLRDDGKYRLARHRTDLLPIIAFDDPKYAKISEAKLWWNVAVSKEGKLKRVRTKAEAAEEEQQQNRVIKIGIPNIVPVGEAQECDECLLRGELDEGIYTCKIWSDQLRFLAPMIRRCVGVKGVLGPILQVLGAGAESVNLECCYQLVEKTFDKTDVVHEVMGGGGSSQSSSASWVFTSYLWVMRRTFTFEPSPDILTKFFDKLEGGKSSRDHIMREMRNSPVQEVRDPKMIELFKEGTGGQNPGPKTDRYLRLRAEKIKERKYFIDLHTIPKCGEPCEGKDLKERLATWEHKAQKVRIPKDPTCTVWSHRPAAEDRARMGKTYDLQEKGPERMKWVDEEKQTQPDLESMLDDDTGEPLRAGSLDGSTEDDFQGTIEQCLDKALQYVRQRGKNVQEWSLLVGMEPKNPSSVHEYMHEAKRAKVAGDEAGYIRNAMKSVDAILKKSKTKEVDAEPGKHDTKGAKSFSAAEIEAVLAAHLSELERMVKGLEDGETERHRFEAAFHEECRNMIRFVDDFLITLKDDEDQEGDDYKAHQILCRRTKADLLRYMHVWVPACRRDTHEAVTLYKQAFDIAGTLTNKRHVAALTACINLSTFHCETERRMDLAARVCRTGLGFGSDADYMKNPKRKEKPKEWPPSMIFNWNLIRHNLAAYETQLVILLVSFEEIGFELHRRVGPRFGDPDYQLKVGDPGYDEKEHGPKASSVVQRDEADALADKFKLCVGMRDRVCPSYMQNCAGMGTPVGGPMEDPKAAESLEDWKRTILHWMRGTPLSELFTNPDTVNSELPESQVSTVRWVQHVEEQEIKDAEFVRPHEEGDSDSDGGGHADNVVDINMHLQSVKQKLRDRQKQALQGCEFNKNGAGDGTMSFKMACAVRLMKDVITDARPRDIDDEHNPWMKEIRKGLERSGRACEDEWKSPQPQPVPAETKDYLDAIVDHLDPGGVVLRPYYVGGRAILRPGDILLLPGEDLVRDVPPPPGSSGHCGSMGSYQNYLKHTAICPITLMFLPCLKVSGVAFVARGPYVEVHQNFVGFRDPPQPGAGAAPLYFAPAKRDQDASPRKRSEKPPLTKFDQVAKDLRSEFSQAGQAGGKVEPKRVRNLSARRNPTLAGHRGCL